ncbi:hypothetical protein LPICM17_30029 [Lactococcus piscium]|nr:hypothetical protein LPICM17_30029 [Lactococcus piscium]
MIAKAYKTCYYRKHKLAYVNLIIFLENQPIVRRNHDEKDAFIWLITFILFITLFTCNFKTK